MKQPNSSDSLADRRNGRGRTSRGAATLAALLLTLGQLAGASDSPAPAVEHVVRHTAVFDRPPTKVPTAGMPDGPLLGNGDVGVALAGPPEAQRFHLGKNDFWRRTPADASVMTVGHVLLSVPALRGATYHEVQELAGAEVHGRFTADGITLETDARVDANENLLVITVRCTGRAPLVIDVRLVAGAPEPPKAAAPGDRGASAATRDALVRAGLDESPVTGWFTRAADALPGRSREVAVATRVLGSIDARLVDGGLRLVLKPGEAATVVTAILSDLDASEPQSAAKARVAALRPVDLEPLATGHRRWWSEFWSKSFIEIPDPELERHWYAALYVMGSCSRAGKVAPGLWGNWITTDHPAWHGDFHLNYNFQAPFYIVYSANHPELSLPFYEAIRESLPNGRAMARRHGWKGVHFPVCIGPWGLSPEDPDGDWGQRSDAVYAALNFIWHWQYTRDREFLRTTAYPYLREVGDFWEDYLRLEQGRYVIVSDSIHEGSGPDFNPLLSLGLVRTLFGNLLSTSSELGVDAERRAKWQDILDRLSAFPLQVRDGRTVYRYSEKGMAWHDGNTLGIQHIFPAGAIGLGSDPGQLTIARDMITAMSRWSDDNGFSSWYTACARVGVDPALILARMRAECDRRSLPNLVLHYGGGGIENVAGFLALTEMLLQSHDGVLRLFPAWPREQPARFAGLRTVGAFLVSAEFREGAVRQARIRSDRGGTCTVDNPWPDRTVRVLRSGRAAEVLSGRRLTFPTTEGENLELKAEP